jgi:hypothetical protein
MTWGPSTSVIVDPARWAMEVAEEKVADGGDTYLSLHDVLARHPAATCFRTMMAPCSSRGLGCCSR